MPDLDFRIEGAQVLEFAATPSLQFQLQIENRGDEPIRSIALNTQIRILTNWRQYSAGEQERLVELFGAARRWGETQGSMLWTHTTVLVPSFSQRTAVAMPVPCTYDFEVASAKYFAALQDGEVPLEFLFSGTVFSAGEAGLQAAQIPWDKEARFQFPVRVWQQMMEHCFPNSAWLRLRKDTFERLYEYRSRNALPTWEAALDALFDASVASVEGATR